MIPVKLTLAGFLSYRDPVEVNFEAIDVACISGSNGAGKSSLLDGITWSLFGHARKRDDSVINTRAETAEVTFEFDYEGNRYRIMRAKTRNKPTLLEFHIETAENGWKPLTERTLRATETRISETLRLDFETFINASFFLQGQADQFTQQRTGDRKRILSAILGLEVWESYRSQAVKSRKEVEDNIAGLDGRLQEIINELNQEEQRRKRLEELESGLKTVSESRAAQESALDEMRRRAAAVAEQEKLVQTLANQLERAQTQLAGLQDRLGNRQREKAQYDDLMSRAKEIEKRHANWQAARAELEKWNATAAEAKEHDEKLRPLLSQIESERAQLEAEVAQLRKTQAEIEQTATEQKGLETRHKTLEAEFDAIQARIAEKQKLEQERQDLVKRQAEAKGQNPILKEEMDSLKSRIDQLKVSTGATCPLCGQPLAEEDRHKLLEELEVEGTAKGDKYRANQTLLKEGDAHIQELEKNIAALKTVEGEQLEHTKQIEQVNAHLTIILEQAEVWEKEGSARLKDIEDLLKTESYAAEARQELAGIESELKEIGYEPAAHDTARQKESELRPVETEALELEKAKAALEPLEREIGELEQQIEKESGEIEKQAQEHAEAAKGLEKVQADAPNLAEAESRMLRLQEEENRIRFEVGAAQQEVNVLDDQRKRRTELESRREEYARQVAQYKALERAFGKDGVPAMLIEQALPQIETKANEILERLSGGNMSVRFITQAAYKDARRDDLRETLDIQISDNAGMRDYEMYSGGEAFRINFAIRLALSEVLAQRAGARLQTLVIDEGFGSQDEAGRQRLIEAINLVKEDFAKILVITHIDALKDAFPARIEVEKTARGSMATVV